MSTLLSNNVDWWWLDVETDVETMEIDKLIANENDLRATREMKETNALKTFDVCRESTNDKLRSSPFELTRRRCCCCYRLLRRFWGSMERLNVWDETNERLWLDLMEPNENESSIFQKIFEKQNILRLFLCSKDSILPI